MKNVVLTSNALLGIAGASGIVWYFSQAQRPFMPLLAYFALLGLVGAVGTAATLTRRDAVRFAAKTVNWASLIVTTTATPIAFAVSPGTGAAALPFLTVVAAVNILTLPALAARPIGMGRLGAAGSARWHGGRKK